MSKVPHEAIAYTKYEIDCPACEDVFEVDFDPANELVACDSCDARIRIMETR